MAAVVQFPPPRPRFSLREVLDNRGDGVIARWLSAHQGARAKLRIRVGYLRRIPRAEWNVKQFRSLGGGLWEIKWKFGKKEFRIIGFDYRGDFVCLIGCTHAQNVYDPANCLATAAYRKTEVENGQRRTREFEP